jgi:aerobic-type carbon monoxide dehydrogenase small subunit (CoxS/CutS family)
MSDDPSAGRDEPKDGFTRRDLMRGALVGAVAASVGGKAVAESDPSLGPSPVPVSLKVNGQSHQLLVEPRVVLVDALRDRIGLTGTKTVCGRGACGACTVLVDGAAQCSCLLLAVEVAGKSITTIEGLKSDNRLAPIQQAFVEADALQCGFCTSGMVMSCKALLDRNPHPTHSEIREAVAGNLCRCGTYPHVFAAVERVAGLKTAESLTILDTTGKPTAVASLSADERVAAATLEVALEEA